MRIDAKYFLVIIGAILICGYIGMTISVREQVVTSMEKPQVYRAEHRTDGNWDVYFDESSYVIWSDSTLEAYTK